MKAKTVVAVAALASLLAGCMTTPVYQTYEPIVDMHNKDRDQYQKDLYECREYAARVDQEAATANGAIAGALVMGLLGAAVGLRGRDLATVTAAGAAGGAANQNVNAGLTQAQIITNCLIGRGYLVLGG